MQAISQKNSDMKLQNFVEGRVHGYFQQCHFTQVSAPQDSELDDICTHLSGLEKRKKVYFFDQRCSCDLKKKPSRHLFLVTKGVSTVIYDAYFIAMIDEFLRETLAIEQCELSINFCPCGHDCVIEKLCSQCTQQWQLLQETLMMLSVTYIIDLSIRNQRGYASGTQFVFSSRLLGSDTLFCSGGRFDSDCCVTQCDFTQLIDLVAKNQSALILPQEAPLNIVIPASSQQYQVAILLTQHLVLKGRCIDILFPQESLEASVRDAERMGAHYALLIGPDELKHGTVIVKNLFTGQASIVRQTEVFLVIR